MREICRRLDVAPSKLSRADDQSNERMGCWGRRARIRKPPSITDGINLLLTSRGLQGAKSIRLTDEEKHGYNKTRSQLQVAHRRPQT